MVKSYLANMKLSLRKKYSLYACNHRNAEKEVILKFQTISIPGLVFVIAFTVHELGTIFTFVLVTTSPLKKVKLDN